MNLLHWKIRVYWLRWHRYTYWFVSTNISKHKLSEEVLPGPWQLLHCFCVLHSYQVLVGKYYTSSFTNIYRHIERSYSTGQLYTYSTLTWGIGSLSHASDPQPLANGIYTQGCDPIRVALLKRSLLIRGKKSTVRSFILQVHPKNLEITILLHQNVPKKKRILFGIIHKRNSCSVAHLELL